MSTRKPNYAETYMQHVAIRNEVIRILTEWFGGKDGEVTIGAVADEILAIDPKRAMEKMMAGEAS